MCAFRHHHCGRRKHFPLCCGGTSQKHVIDKWCNVHKTTNHWDGFFRFIIVLLIIIINLLFRKTPKPSQAFPPSTDRNSITVLVELNLLIFHWEILFFIYFCFMDWDTGTYLPEGTKLFYLEFFSAVNITGWKEALDLVLRLGLPQTGAHSAGMFISYSYYCTECCFAYSS